MPERRIECSSTVADGVADVRLTRGDKHNGLDWAMFEALNEAIDEVAADEEARVVVLSGEGPSFCAGLDFKSFMSEDRGGPRPARLERRDGEPTRTSPSAPRTAGARCRCR